MKVLTLITLLLMILTFGCQPAMAQSSPSPTCREIAIFGAVRKAGRLSVQRRERLNEVLLRAGGVTERAGKVVRVFHLCDCSPCNSDKTNGQESIEYNLRAVMAGQDGSNVYVEPGD